MRENQSFDRLIPETVLRSLYRLLRDFPKQEFHLQFAKEFVRRPQPLDANIYNSFNHCSFYENEEEAFHDRGVDGAPTQRRRNSKKLSDRFAVQLYDQTEVQLESGLSFSYVDYDISPLRTRGRATFDSGATGTKSGRGGIDALLVNSWDRLPIIGEIKAEKDSTPLLALIQALMYSIELSTPHQRKRLQRAYPERFDCPIVGPWVDIYLFLVRPPERKQDQEFLALVDELSAKLMRCEFVPTAIRRIACLETPFTDNEPLSFQLRFLHQAK